MRTSSTLLVAGTLLVVAACGGSDDTADTAPDTIPGASTPAATTPAGTAAAGTPTPDTAAPDTAAPDSAAATTAAPATTTAETAATTTVPPQPTFDLTQLADVVALIDPERPATAPPLELAQRIVGFPLAIPVPEGSTLWDAVGRFRTVEESTLETSFEYWAIGPDGAVPDVDIELDDNGPGSQQIIEVFDPIMADLGFERKASTASDPGDPGGPNSVNHVYEPVDPVGVFNGVPGSVGNVFVWADEDIDGGSYRNQPLVGGYRVDLDVDSVEIPVPLLAALAESFPTPPDVVLTDGSVRVQRRTPESFLADRGLAYLDVRLEWTAPTDAFDAIVEFYGDDVFDAPWRAAEPSFFNDGEWEPAEQYEYDGTDRRLDVLLLDRYSGLLGIDVADEPDGPTTMTLDLDLDTIAPELTAPAS